MAAKGISKRAFLEGATAAGLMAGLSVPASGQGLTTIETGPFLPKWSSLAAGYSAPAWFRDAKFGIWAHWGPQCAPEAGDWYARNMYLQGHWQYEHHLKHYGHPADTGFMDIIRTWTADHFDPGALLDLYKKAGAKYFVALANHHDNFDTFASKYHAWNATRVGPKKDLLGMFAKAARERGLRFGVSNHSAHAWHWYQPAYGYDPEGARKGERYDAARLTQQMGRGKWWEGLDPQALYCGPVMPMPDGIASIKEANDWHDKHDAVWDENPPAANRLFVLSWLLRCKDLIDSYKPDMIYFDDTGLPLGDVGLQMAAHFYNSSIKWHGELEAVINAKCLPETRRAAVVEDAERGLLGEIREHPWQTDTCLGSWHYDRSYFFNNTYKTPSEVIHILCDTVSKNGNLLLSVPVRGDGTIDEKETAIVEAIGGWMSRFSEAIYGTRPWKVAGEGPTRMDNGGSADDASKAFTAADIRYTTKDGALYALTLGEVRSGSLTLQSLRNANVTRVEIVGSAAPLSFRQTPEGLVVEVPEAAGHPFGIALKIAGQGLV